ncbi:hypothetical protein [Roseibium litorale]|uniref:Uncharacterized protein n=1 Tax=Roseibium litorale TaxID=2803841 RepID=A0ABR9CMD0_9HYPH|nr:hypothetical protein [Roseibium litorale]MBD8892007.1 hypothetical protein [Roseibium litorale]
MDFLDSIKNKIPAIGFISLLLSATYHAGLLNAAASIDIISSLSYQDIIIASLYIFPILLSSFYAISAIKDIIYLEGKFDKWWKYGILFLIFTLGLASFYLEGNQPSSFTWILLIFSASPLIYKIIKKLNKKS